MLHHPPLGNPAGGECLTPVRWEYKKFSRWMVFLGTAGLLAFLLIGIYITEWSAVGVFAALFFSLYLCRTYLFVKNPVILSLGDEGLTLRGKIFIPYEDVVAFSLISMNIYRGFRADRSLLYFKDRRTVARPKKFFFIDFLFWGRVDENGVVCLMVPYSSSTNHAHKDVAGEMFERYRHKTGGLLSYNYYPDLYKARLQG